MPNHDTAGKRIDMRTVSQPGEQAPLSSPELVPAKSYVQSLLADATAALFDQIREKYGEDNLTQRRNDLGFDPYTELLLAIHMAANMTAQLNREQREFLGLALANNCHRWEFESLDDPARLDVGPSDVHLEAIKWATYINTCNG